MSQGVNREEELFDQARRLNEPSQRAAFLEANCASDAELRHRVEELLAGQAEADDLFRPLEPLAGEHAPVGQASLCGLVIGRYKLLEQIGEGGMGIVYLAEQSEPVKRQVALKVIKLGMDSRQVVARFEAERQALALMDHPNIAKVLDGGVIGAPESGLAGPGSQLTTGRPYFVMELVRGVTITEFCQKKDLSVEERLDLFIQVCQAVQHAHQKGIIHRDLKPSNILITVNDAQALPKVIDFGVAKATQQGLTDRTIFTQFHQFIGTPAYMSPEQAGLTGVDIDTRSDIYSLGVLLYELLTGQPPFEMKQLLASGLDEMRRIIRETEPERPSTRLAQMACPTQSKIQNPKPKIEPDLDWIVMKCLEKDRGRRYETANGLAADLKRLLAHEPVVARPPSASYRFSKLVRRHRAASIATAVIAMTIALAAAVAAAALARERAARKTADERLRIALLLVDQVVTNLAPRIEKLTGAATVLETLGRSSLDSVQRLRLGASDDPMLRVSLARTLLYLSSVQNPGGGNTVGDYETGLRCAREAADLLSRALPTLGEKPRLQLLVEARFAEIQCLYGLGRLDEVTRRSDEVVALYEQLERLEKTGNPARLARRQQWNIRANAAYATLLAGDLDKAIERTEAVLNSRWVQGLTDGSDEDELEILANSRANLAAAQGLLNRFAAMLSNAASADHIWTNLVARSPQSARYKVGRVEGWSLHGWALVATGHPEDGLPLLKQARRESDGLVEKDAVNDQFQLTRAVTTATQALAFLGWTLDSSAAPAERRRRMDQVESYLTEAEGFARLAKSKEAEARVALARQAIMRAKARYDRPVAETNHP
jgi:serine/threonine protein kinase